MPITTEDGLGPLIDCAVFHEHPASGIKPWTTNYQFAKLTDFDPEETFNFLGGLASVDALAHLSVVDIVKATANRHIPKTTQPLGDTVVYNPSNHVERAFDFVGLQAIGGDDIMAHTTVLDFVRNPAFGNPGKIECRGLLTAQAVGTTFPGHTLLTPSAYEDIVVDWINGLITLAGDYACVLVLAGEPQLTNVPSIVEGKVHWTKTFGDTIIRAIIGGALGAIRQDNNDYKYFDVAP